MANETLSVNLPHHRVGPMALRQGWVQPPIFDLKQAAITDTNFKYPEYPQSKTTGPAALRMPPPYFPQTNPQPTSDTNFVMPAYSPRMKSGPTVLRGGKRAYYPAPDIAPLTDNNFEFQKYPASRTVGPQVLRKRQAQPLPAPKQAGSFPTQYDGFYLRTANASIALCLVALADAPTNMGGQLRFQKGGVTYALYLVETTDPNASPLRVKTSSGVKSVRLKT